MIGVLVRASRASEAPACRMLLPETLADVRMREYRLALASSTPKIAGAISFRDTGHALEALRVHVVAPMRRNHVGETLLRNVIAEARARGRSEVSAFGEQTAESGGAALLRSIGFEVASRLFTAECDVVALDYNNRLQDLPVSIVPLTTDLARQAGQLYGEYIAEIPHLANANLRVTGDLSRFHLSRVLLADGQVEGLMLVEQMGSTAVVHARIVREKYRRGRASALLATRTLEHLQSTGIQRMRFQYLETTRDTIRTAQRFKAKITSCVERLIYRLT